MKMPGEKTEGWGEGSFPPKRESIFMFKCLRADLFQNFETFAIGKIGSFKINWAHLRGLGMAWEFEMLFFICYLKWSHAKEKSFNFSKWFEWHLTQINSFITNEPRNKRSKDDFFLALGIWLDRGFLKSREIDLMEICGEKASSTRVVFGGEWLFFSLKLPFFRCSKCDSSRFQIL